jgi:hypothetical protein
MTSRFAAGLVLSLSVGFASCGSQAPASLEEACAKLAECRADVTVEQCLDLFISAVTPAQCYEAMRSAPCEDHQQPTAYREDCFPTCFAPSQQCVGDTLLACIDWGAGEYRRSLLTCEGICAGDDKTYTGICGRTSPGGLQSDEDVCWCVSG